MKNLFGLIVLTMITFNINAQHSSSPRGFINLGIKGGVNMYNYDNFGYDQLSGFHFGLLGHIHLNNPWAIQPELLYSNQGAKIGDSNNILDYINIPVLLQYMYDNGFRLQAGPQLGILLRADNRDAMNPIDFGLSIGASYVLPATGFGVDARYNHGITNINKNDAVVATNRGFQIGVFYIFGHN
jgi:hypothetical protein